MIKKIVNYYKKWFWSDEEYARSIGVSIGRNCYIGSNHFGSEPYLIKIGDHVQITSGVRIFTHGAGWVFRNKFPDFDYFGKVIIGNNVYIGNCALIMPGVVIGDNVIIGAGSIVTKSVENNSIMGGNPARLIGKVSQLEEKLLPYNLNTKRMTREQKKDFLKNLGEESFIRK